MKTPWFSPWYELYKSLRNHGYAVKLVGEVRDTSLMWALDQGFVYSEKLLPSP